MKFPSLIKIPRHQRFHLKPRYYDPIKEDVENRETTAGLPGGRSTEVWLVKSAVM